MTRNNRNFKLIRGALALTRAEVVECLRLAGVTVGADSVRRWLSHPNEGAQHYTAMTDSQFDAFCAGLSQLMYARRQGAARD